MSINSDWIKGRLPAGCTFKKNGLTATVDEAIDAALTANDDNRKLALADLLEMLAADITHDTQTVDQETYTGPLLMERAEALRAEADADDIGSGASSGSFSSGSVQYSRCRRLRDELSA
jgi:hypothetical protein